MNPTVERRAQLHAALADPTRVTLVDALAVSDRTPGELATTLDIAPSLLAHHLDVLEDAGLVHRVASSGDRRRRYVRLDHGPLRELGTTATLAPRTMLFVCTHNSARSQLAAAMWRDRMATSATSAGTHPAERVHPGAVAAAARAGLDLTTSTPHLLDLRDDVQVVTVCDRAHEELDPDESWWHWSIPDPVAVGSPAAFDAVVTDLSHRLALLTPEPNREHGAHMATTSTASTHDRTRR